MAQYVDSDEDWDNWESDQDDEDYAVPTPDLFDKNLIHPSPKAFKQYTITNYQFNIEETFKEYSLNTYNRIRLVNYLRKQITTNIETTVTPTNLIEFIKQNKSQWKNNDEDLLLPTMPNDGLIQYAATLADGFESDGEEWDEDGEEDGDEDDDVIADEDADVEEVQHRVILQQKQTIAAMNRQIDELETLLAHSRKALKDYALDPEEQAAISSTQNNNNKAKPTTQAVTAVNSRENEEGYFAGYSERLIHEVMLSDVHRTNSYRQAFISLKEFVKDKVVLDVGCGTGILSMFAAQNGAKLVIGVDAADIIDKTREIVKKNGLADKVQLIKGKLEEVVLPVDTVDCIVSEWMGYYLLFESMLPSVFYARNKWMRRVTGESLFATQKQQGVNVNSFDYSFLATSQGDIAFHPETRLLPDVARMFVAGANAKTHRKTNLNFWQDVYGFDMSCLISTHELYPSSHVEIVPGEEIQTTDALYGCWDLMRCEPQELTFETQDIEITVDHHGDNNNEIIDSFVVWFDTPFTVKLDDDSVWKRQKEQLDTKNVPTVPIHDNGKPDDKYDHIILTTSPYHTPTHWKQTLFRIQNIIKAKAGDKIKLTIVSTPRKDNIRHYDIAISYTFLPQNIEDSKSIVNESTNIPNTRYAEPGVAYTQKYSLQ